MSKYVGAPFTKETERTHLDDKVIEDGKFAGIDDVGHLFTYQGGVYRGCYQNKIEQTRHLFDSGTVDDLCSKRMLPRTLISPYYTDSYNLVLWHEKIWPVTYSYERVTFNMIKDEALFVLDFAAELARRGLSMKDCHRENLLYDCHRPIYIDFGSIIRLPEKFYFHCQEFISSYLLPLKLLAIDAQGAYRLIRDCEDFNELLAAYQGFVNSDINLPFYKQRLESDLSGVRTSQELLDVLRQAIENVKEKRTSTMWSSYQDGQDFRTLLEGTQKLHGEFSRFEEIMKIIDTLQPDSVFELGCNEGVLATLLMQGRCGERIDRYIASDYDVQAVDKFYTFLKMNCMQYDFLNKIHPVVIDFTSRLGRYGDKDFADRFCSELVIATALTHHLLLGQGMPIDAMFERFARCTSRYIVIEFMPKGLWDGGHDFPRIPEWYTQDTFQRSMEKHFKILTVKQLEINRVVFVGELIL